MALTADRMIKRRDAVQFQDPVAAATTIFTGALVCLNAAGFAVPGATATGLVARGVCEEQVANPGSAGDEVVNTRAGCFNFRNSADADEITRAHIGDVAYIVDDETVAATDGTASRSAAGRIADVNDDGVWVEVGALSITIEAA